MSAENHLATRQRGMIGGLLRLGVSGTRTPLRSHPTELSRSAIPLRTFPPVSKLLLYMLRTRDSKDLFPAVCAPLRLPHPRDGSITTLRWSRYSTERPLSSRETASTCSEALFRRSRRALHALVLASPRLVRGSIRFAFPIQPWRPPRYRKRLVLSVDSCVRDQPARTVSEPARSRP